MQAAFAQVLPSCPVSPLRVCLIPAVCRCFQVPYFRENLISEEDQVKTLTSISWFAFLIKINQIICYVCIMLEHRNVMVAGLVTQD